MPITYASLPIFVVSLIAIVIAWRYFRSTQQGGNPPEANETGPASIMPIDARGDLSNIDLRKKAFDPDATMVYKRSALAPTPAAQRNREGPVVAGACLIGLSGRQRGKSFPVVATGLTIGRSSTCDIVLDDVRVSLRHAWIGIVDNKAVLRDLKSTNGTFLNTGSQSSVSKAELCSGDTIFFGGHQGDQFRFMAN